MRPPIPGTWRAWAVVALLAITAPGGCRGRAAAPEASSGAQPPVPALQSPAPPLRTDIGFRSRQRLTEHYLKHGHEFGRLTIQDYLRRAQLLRDRAVGGDVLELVRVDGVVTRFDRASGDFIAFDADGTIRTFFRPNDGENYFRRQARRTASP
jgi:hypothetical protein